MSKHCPVCTEKIIPADGDVDAKILLIGSEPSEDEINYNRPFVGDTIRIFRKELLKLSGIDLMATRQVLINYHAKMKKEDCMKVSMSIVEAEMEGKSLIVLVGADAVRTFTGLSVQNVNGMDVTSEVYSDIIEKYPQAIFFAITSPQTVFKSLGEFRYGLNNLGEIMKGLQNG